MVHSAHLQQLQAHLIRSASTSPFLSPQNSLQASAALLHTQAAAAAAAQAVAAAGLHTPTPYFPIISCSSGTPNASTQPVVTGHLDLATRLSESTTLSKEEKSAFSIGVPTSLMQIRSSSTGPPSSSSTSSSNKLNHLEPSSNVVSSTMEDDDSREGILQSGNSASDHKKQSTLCSGAIKVSLSNI